MKKLVKFGVLIITGVLILNLVLMALGKISVGYFWLIIILGGISSFVITKVIKPKL